MCLGDSRQACVRVLSSQGTSWAQPDSLPLRRAQSEAPVQSSHFEEKLSCTEAAPLWGDSSDTCFMTGLSLCLQEGGAANW